MPILWYETLQSVLAAQLCGMIHLVRNKQLWLKKLGIFFFWIKSGFPSALYFRGLCDPPKNFLRVLSMEKSGVPWDPYPEVVLLHKQIKDQNCLKLCTVWKSFHRIFPK